MEFFNDHLNGNAWDDPTRPHAQSESSKRVSSNGDAHGSSQQNTMRGSRSIDDGRSEILQQDLCDNEMSNVDHLPNVSRISGTHSQSSNVQFPSLDTSELSLFENDLNMPYTVEENHIQAQLPEQMQSINSRDMSSEYYSPTLSFEGTPILSPNVLVPQSPARTSLGSAAVGSASEYGYYYASSQTRRTSGKITKQSPSVRARADSYVHDEDEFQLGDPALEGSEPATTSFSLQQVGTNTTHPVIHPKPVVHVNQDIEERIRSAIAATARAQSRSNSLHRSASNSRRASTTSSNRNTPRIRPKVNGTRSADPSPLMCTQDSSAEHIDGAFMKSNYQNLLDGTHKHLGLTSADQLASELRSKKTIHKLAEQERRQRMNQAISELSLLLGPGDDKSIVSKAATVERAISHIKKLRKRISDLEHQKESAYIERISKYERGASSENSPNSGTFCTPGNNSFTSSDDLSPLAVVSPAKET